MTAIQIKEYHLKDWFKRHCKHNGTGKLERNRRHETEKQNCLDATKIEIKSLENNNTFAIPPTNKKAIGCKWILKAKTNSKVKLDLLPKACYKNE